MGDLGVGGSGGAAVTVLYGEAAADDGARKLWAAAVLDSQCKCQ